MVSLKIGNILGNDTITILTWLTITQTCLDSIEECFMKKCFEEIYRNKLILLL